MALADPHSHPVKVGLLNSLSDSIAELPMRDAALMAIAEINASGGVLGSAIEPVIRDSSADPAEFAEQVQKLIQEDRVRAIFSGGSSQTRKAIISIIDKTDCSFWYPFAYEGLEQSQNIFYTGSCPNQLIEPAITWLLTEHFSKSAHPDQHIYLLGDNTVFSRTVGKIAKALLKPHQAITVTERYVLPWGAAHIDFGAIAQQINQSGATIIFNLMSSFNTIDFYAQYRQMGLDATNIEIISLNLSEAELQQIAPSTAAGHYSCSSYFQHLDRPENTRFVRNFQNRYGLARVTAAPIETAYTQIYLWQQAAEMATSFEPSLIATASQIIDFAAPSGMVQLSADRHAYKCCRIGRVEPDGKFKLVYESDSPIKPLPWLGLEDANVQRSPLIIELLAQVAQHSDANAANLRNLDNAATIVEHCKLPLYPPASAITHPDHDIDPNTDNDAEIDLLTLLAVIDEVILVFDRQGYCLQIAPTQTKDLIEHPRSQIGKSVYEVLPHEQAEMYHRFIQLALDSQTAQEIEYYLYINDQKTWFFARVSPISAHTVVWVARNITDYKHTETELQKITADLETEVAERTKELLAANKSLRSQVAERQHAEAELRALFSSITDVILVLDRQGRYLEIAPPTSEALYQPAEQMLGRTMHEVLPRAKADEMIHHINRALQAQQTIQVEYSLEINGKETWFSANVSPMLEKQVVWVARDITERKQSEATLKNAKEAIEKTYQARNIFLSTMSHELRTPLNAIIGYTEVLQEDVVEWGHAEIVEDLEKIRTAGKHLLNLINDILDISRIEAGRISLYLEDFDVRLLVEELATTIQTQAQKNHNQLVINCEAELGEMYGDLSKIRQCIYNLLSNACKFTHDGQIKLSVASVEKPIADPNPDIALIEEVDTQIQEIQSPNTAHASYMAKANKPKHHAGKENNQAEQSDRYISFSISDTGIGIEPERLPELFAPFTQADNSITRKYGGTGLGLAITNKICQLLGGKITVKSKLGKGSTFTIQLPQRFVKPQDNYNSMMH
jgi:PAS domain S-box-containing protein